ncbi:hypothetical protein BU26DRAFT_450388 [Trematosphaeria pertusa]|uniref:EKC/KEOPS complex subunit BUD32 n=1 Tax=Trematosphaeria pertusa TaxID=390896 RepID=A0A6A6ITS9_9PLEO|nr:uncharacterized protein BU26DRAFT_450388 [Trematosphaeria pertusa]KAF2253517.1 hypothetical protein BU26DRAFT_450388 [Trematosphaeria pertusa]
MTITPATQPSDCMTFTIKSQSPMGMELVGAGGSAQVYKIDEHVVLKALTAYEPPTSDASLQDYRFYASETLFSFSLMNDERTVFRLLERLPHPNIVEAIDTDHAEGIYLRKYRPLSEFRAPAQPGRILWYQDIIRALLHLHNLRISHSDVRIENVLFDTQGRALLCDFSASCPFGYPNLAYPRPDLPIPLNGPAKTISDATDRFAMASLIFQMETGTQPELSVDDNRALVLPEIRTGHNGIDSMIRKAWLGQYSSTAQMLEHAESLHNDGNWDTHSPITQPTLRDALRDRVRQWREDREKEYGYVTYPLPTEDQLQSLADRYGWDVDEEVHFRDYKAPHIIAEGDRCALACGNCPESCI